MNKNPQQDDIVYMRIKNKHDTTDKWESESVKNFIPLDGELIIYDADGSRYRYPRIKIGDGVTDVQDLPFISNNELGDGSEATGIDAVAQGKNVKAEGDYSHAFGLGTVAEEAYQFVVGKYNASTKDKKYAFVVGGGNETTTETTAAVCYDGTLKTTGIEISSVIDQPPVSDNTTTTITSGYGGLDIVTTNAQDGITLDVSSNGSGKVTVKGELDVTKSIVTKSIVLKENLKICGELGTPEYPCAQIGPYGEAFVRRLNVAESTTIGKELTLISRAGSTALDIFSSDDTVHIVGSDRSININGNCFISPDGTIITCKVFDGKATRADRLDVKEQVGSPSKPVYFSDYGVPVACDYDVNEEVDHATNDTYGTIKGSKNIDISTPGEASVVSVRDSTSITQSLKFSLSGNILTVTSE